MFLLVPAHPGSPRQRAIKRWLLLYLSYESLLQRLIWTSVISIVPVILCVFNITCAKDDT